MGEEGVKRIMDEAWRNPLAAAGIFLSIVGGVTAATTIYIEIQQVGAKVADLNTMTAMRLKDLEDEKYRIRIELSQVQRDQNWMMKAIERAELSGPPLKRGPH
jgi:hypothetical protein